MFPFRDLEARRHVARLEQELEAARQEIARQRAAQAEWEVLMTGLTDKLSSQLKRLAQRARDAGGDQDEPEFPELGPPLTLDAFNRLR